MDRHNFRQVHLDFHTSAECGAIATNFNAKAFASTLKAAHVKTVNIFGRCHHGYCYYPTTVGTMHPGLQFDLLGAQIEALHHENITCPIYLTVKWDDLAGKQHPEWICVRKDGRVAMRTPLSGEWGWTTMDVNSGYGEYFMAILEEVLDRYGDAVDGLWFDICFPTVNYSAWGQEQMRKDGINLEDDRAVWLWARQKDLQFFARVTELVKQKAPRATYYFNGTTTPAMSEVAAYVTHFEVESLPTTGTWGYLHYPLIARQARTYGKEVIGMTGRFHHSWGDFGGLKTVDQLDYECGTILAAGGKVCVGDQLHPNGVLDPAVYRLIGNAYEKVKLLEPWLQGVSAKTEIGILVTEPIVNEFSGVAKYGAGVEGAAQMFLEAGIQFDIVDGTANLDKYRALVLTEDGKLEDRLADTMRKFLARGGKIISSGMAAYDIDQGVFQFDQMPVELIGKVPTVPCYLRPPDWMCDRGHLASDYDYAFYEQAYLVRAKSGAHVFGEMRRALFNRTWEHFISHQHAPVGESLDCAIAAMNEWILHMAAPLFRSYRTQDYYAYKVMTMALIGKFLPGRIIEPRGPGWVEWSVLHRDRNEGEPEREIVFAVAYHPRRTAQAIQRVDESWEISRLGFRLQLNGRRVLRVYLPLEKTEAAFSVNGNVLDVNMPDVRTYSVAVVEYA